MTTITVGGSSVTYRDFSIEIPVSSVGVAPTATITAQARESITAGDSVTITIDGTDRFDGVAVSGGTKSRTGGLRVECEHRAIEFFEEEVTVSLSSPTSFDVLDEARLAADSGGTFSLDAPTGATLPEYDVSGRSVKRIFRDVCDRNGWVWWVDPAGNTIHVQAPEARGQWQALDSRADKVRVKSFDSGNIDTVRNNVTVVGTGDERVTGGAKDQTSIDTYGVRTGASPYNVSYITTQAEADAYAQALLVTDPLAEGEIAVGRNVGTVTAPLVNQTVDLTDAGKDIDATGLLIEKQTIEQGRATLQIGQGNGASIAEVNREAKSRDDITTPGSVYGNDRLSSDSVDTNQLVDSAVIENKLEDLSVSLQKVQNGAIDTVKIRDDAIEAPKILAGEITAEKLNTELARAQRLLAGNIEAQDIAADTITANQIQTLDLETAELEIGTDSDGPIRFDVTGANKVAMLPQLGEFASVGLDNGKDYWFGFGAFEDMRITTAAPENDNVGEIGNSTNSYSSMWAYDFIDADSGTAINDGGDVLAALERGQGPPDFCRPCDDDGEVVGVSINKLTRHLWDICTAQQDKLRRAEDRIDELEDRLAALEDTVGGNA